LVFVKDELLQENETQTQLTEALQERCTKVSKQNTLLLQRLQEMELEAEDLEHKVESKGK
jgi:predicted nuclease with TOPRIM domain